MDIKDYTLDELRAMEEFGADATFNAIVIVPTGDLHDSGYGNMKFILMSNGEIVGVVGGYSDVVHINGIGGYGLNYKETMVTNMVRRVGWSIDCLPTSGCLRLFADRGVKCKCADYVLSDFEFFVEE